MLNMRGRWTMKNPVMMEEQDNHCVLLLIFHLKNIVVRTKKITGRKPILVAEKGYGTRGNLIRKGKILIYRLKSSTSNKDMFLN